MSASTITSNANSELWLDDFEHDDVVFFGRDSGFAINLSKDRLIVFQRSNGDWYNEDMKLDVLRSAREIVPYASRQIGISSQGSAHAIGQGIGMAISNAMENGKARRSTGIELSLRSVDQPSFFLNVNDEKTRQSVLEALQQALNDRMMTTPYRLMPEHVRDCYTPLTEEDIAEQAAQVERQRVKRTKTRLTIGDYIIALFFGAIAILPFHWIVQWNAQQLHGRQNKLYAFDAFNYFWMSAIVALFLVMLWKLVRFWIWEARQTNEFAVH